MLGSSASSIRLERSDSSSSSVMSVTGQPETLLETKEQQQLISWSSEFSSDSKNQLHRTQAGELFITTSHGWRPTPVSSITLLCAIWLICILKTFILTTLIIYDLTD